jgi:hypothetical protein
LFTFVSQPLVRASLSQLPQPLAQVMAQLPEEQDEVPFTELQAAPQPPQFCVLVFVLISQPLPRASVSQLAKPVLQVMPHTPLEQEAVPFAELQAAPQLPQF